MILLDVDENAPSKASDHGVSLPEQAETEMAQIQQEENRVPGVSTPYSSSSSLTSELPPPYISRTSFTLPAPSSTVADPEAQSDNDTRPRKRRRRTGRIFRRSLVLLGAITLVSLVTVSHAWITERKFLTEWNLSDVLDPAPLSNFTRNTLEEELGLTCVKNATWSIEGLFFPAHTSFEISLSDVSSFALFSKGLGLSGEVRIIDFGLESNVAKVYVTMTSRTKRTKSKDCAHACLVKGSLGGTSSGLGFFRLKSSATDDTDEEDQFHFDVTILLPSSNGQASLNFLTNLPKFAHKFETEDLIFNNVDITTSRKSVVSVTSLRANSLSIRTSQAPIKGVFDVSQSMLLQTANNLIHANVTLVNDGIIPSRLIMLNSDAEIRSTITLLSDPTSLDHTKYAIDIKAPNTELKLAMPSIPEDADLRVSANTSEKSSVVSVSSQFEGHFLLENSGLGNEPVVLDATAEDSEDDENDSWNLPSRPGVTVTQLVDQDSVDGGRLVVEGSRWIASTSDRSGDGPRVPSTSLLKVTTKNAHNLLILSKD
ncbi:hypothetical protein D9757_006155 [Collybiopsis confluens]|uniref:Uncharacterized protein n=1 Tax=Collybiopsis confluens TaxID=2823264 RepID=A0A8H5HIB8_9AGAR|nr:hypothetical protein D9757_006155 [Collybiopsis confluens]